MLELQKIRENTQALADALTKKHFPNAMQTLQQVLSLDQKRRDLQFQLDENLAQANNLAKQIGALIKQGQQAQAQDAKAQTAQLKTDAASLKDALTQTEQALTALLYTIPNAPYPQVPTGRTAEENEVVFSHGEIPELPSDALPQWDLVKKYNIADFENGTKITGAGFPIYWGKAAKLQRALISFFLDRATQAGYLEVMPPLLINEASGYGTGQLPDKEGQMYHAVADNLYLIPTAEVPITNIYRDTILNQAQLPIKNVGYTPCFRREAGSWGADVRALNRLHQFDKVEIVQITRPEDSQAAHELMLAHVKSLLVDLELPFRILRLCGGDISFNAALCYDFEVFSAAQKRWLEVSSVSNFDTFQANRLKLRYRPDGEKKTVLLHTLNGSALALPRILAALIENNQCAQGIRIPKVLQPYTGFEYLD